MSYEKEFVESIYRVAKRVKGVYLTEEEKSKIIKEFNSLQGDDYDRAIKAIERVIGEIKEPQKRLLEKSAEASANLNRLLSDLERKAKEWGQNNN